MAAQAVDFTLSGHISRAIVFTDVDDGESTTMIEDHGSSGTRFRMTGSSETMSGMAAGVNLEYSQAPGLRHANVFFSGEFGTLKLGHTGEAADGVTYSDKSGVFGIGHGQETGASKAAAYVQGMGGGRNEGVHFSSASFGPAAIHISGSNDDRVSAKLSFGGDAGIASYGGAIAYLDTGETQAKDTGKTSENTHDYEEIAGSLGVRLASGVTFSIAGGSRSGNHEGSFVQSTVGYVFGNNAVGVSYYGSSDITHGVAEKGDGTALGIAFLHTMPKAKVDIIASVQQFSADLTGGSELDDTVAIIGSRIKF